MYTFSNIISIFVLSSVLSKPILNNLNVIENILNENNMERRSYASQGSPAKEQNAHHEAPEYKGEEKYNKVEAKEQNVNHEAPEYKGEEKYNKVEEKYMKKDKEYVKEEEYNNEKPQTKQEYPEKHEIPQYNSPSKASY